MKQQPGNDLILGQIAGRRASLGFPRDLRDKHLYCCGGTGTGKSKFLENLIRQDIWNWRKSRCGMLVLDPHGSMYDSLINWLAWRNIDRPIIPIDLRQDDWVVSYNLVRQREADPQVLVDNVCEAMAYVWGQGGLNETPLFARWAGNIIQALYENKLTLVEAEYLVDHMAKQTRFALTSRLKGRLDRQDWAFADTLNARDFEAQIGSTVNRLQRFIRNQTMRSIFGQRTVSLDLGRALDEGSIILVSLATERAKVSKVNTELFASLLLSDLWTAAQERGKRKGIKPFYVYLDEFQRFVTPTIAENLDESRGYKIYLTLAHQFPNQLLDRGENGRRVYNSVMENASSKVVFRLSHRENLQVMAEWLFMGVMDPDEIQHEMYSTKVMEYREELKTAYGESTTSGTSYGIQRGRASGTGMGGTESFPGDKTEDDPLSTSESWSDFTSDSESETAGRSEGMTRSTSHVPTIVPVLGRELSHVQFRSLQDQLFRAMAVLFDQRQRQGVARLVEMNAPVSLYTPTVHQMPGSEKRTKAYLNRCYEKLPFALRQAVAKKQLARREASLPGDIMKEIGGESITAKRRIHHIHVDE